MGGAAENCRPEPRGTIYMPADSSHNHKRKGTGTRVRGNPCRICVTEKTEWNLSKRDSTFPYLHYGFGKAQISASTRPRSPRSGWPQNSGVLGGIEAADRLHVSDEDVAVVRLGDAVAISVLTDDHRLLWIIKPRRRFL